MSFHAEPALHACCLTNFLNIGKHWSRTAGVYCTVVTFAQNIFCKRRRKHSVNTNTSVVCCYNKLICFKIFESVAAAFERGVKVVAGIWKSFCKTRNRCNTNSATDNKWLSAGGWACRNHLFRSWESVSARTNQIYEVAEIQWTKFLCTFALEQNQKSKFNTLSVFFA